MKSVVCAQDTLLRLAQESCQSNGLAKESSPLLFAGILAYQQNNVTNAFQFLSEAALTQNLVAITYLFELFKLPECADLKKQFKTRDPIFFENAEHQLRNTSPHAFGAAWLRQSHYYMKYLVLAHESTLSKKKQKERDGFVASLESHASTQPEGLWASYLLTTIKTLTPQKKTRYQSIATKLKTISVEVVPTNQDEIIIAANLGSSSACATLMSKNDPLWLFRAAILDKVSALNALILFIDREKSENLWLKLKFEYWALRAYHHPKNDAQHRILLAIELAQYYINTSQDDNIPESHRKTLAILAPFIDLKTNEKTAKAIYSLLATSYYNYLKQQYSEDDFERFIGYYVKADHVSVGEIAHFAYQQLHEQYRFNEPAYVKSRDFLIQIKHPLIPYLAFADTMKMLLDTLESEHVSQATYDAINACINESLPLLDSPYKDIVAQNILLILGHYNLNVHQLTDNQTPLYLKAIKQRLWPCIKDCQLNKIQYYYLFAKYDIEAAVNVSLLIEAFSAGNIYAGKFLSILYETGIDGVLPKDIQKAYDINFKILQLNTSEDATIKGQAACELSKLFINHGGLGRLSIDEAIAYAHLGMELDFEPAIFNLAKLYIIKGDDEKAIHYFLICAESGDVDAMFSLSALHANDINCPHYCLKTAMKWAVCAYQKGFLPAAHNIAILLQTDGTLGEPYQYNQECYLDFLVIAAELFGPSQLSLAVMFKKGLLSLNGENHKARTTAILEVLLQNAKQNGMEDFVQTLEDIEQYLGDIPLTEAVYASIVKGDFNSAWAHAQSLQLSTYQKDYKPLPSDDEFVDVEPKACLPGAHIPGRLREEMQHFLTLQSVTSQQYLALLERFTKKFTEYRVDYQRSGSRVGFFDPNGANTTVIHPRHEKSATVETNRRKDYQAHIGKLLCLGGS